MLRVSALILGLGFSGVAFAGEDHDDHHVAELGGVRAIHAWTRATSGREALVFVDIENGSGKDVDLLGGEAGIAASVELVGFRLQGANAVYEVLPKLPLKAGSELALTPDGAAIRLNGLKQALEKGTEFEMHIEFDTGHLEIHVEVEAADAKQHGHAGHIH